MEKKCLKHATENASKECKVLSAYRKNTLHNSPKHTTTIFKETNNFHGELNDIFCTAVSSIPKDGYNRSPYIHRRRISKI